MELIQKKFEDYQDVITRGEYVNPQTNHLTIMFHGLFYRFETHDEVIKEFPLKHLIDFVNNDYQESVDLNVTHYYDPELLPDAFTLKVKASGDIDIKSNNLRGFKYALEAFYQLFEVLDAEIVYPIIEIYHQPSFQLRGVIEGFYGSPWTHETRKDVLEFLSNERLNTYMYAPKDDELQRKRWRELYPAEKLAEFEELLDISEKNQLDFYYMISPGNDIDYTIESDVATLMNKLQQLIDLGVTHFGLLLDDIDYCLKGRTKRRFQTAAKAHAHLIKEVDSYLKSELADYVLLVCPTEYDNQFDSPYLSELTEEVPQNIPFFWTGPSTLASQISEADIKKMASIFKRPMVIWDNIPVNDYLSDKECLFLSPYENRSEALNKENYRVLGIVSNPMSQWEPSKLTIQNMSQYLWNIDKYEVVSSWNKTMTKFVDKSLVESLATFSKFNPNKYTRTSLTIEQIVAVKNKNHEFITKELDELVEAVEKLNKCSDNVFQKEVLPWYNRAYRDRKRWQMILDNQFKEAKESLLTEKSHRLGCDLVEFYINEHL